MGEFADQFETYIDEASGNPRWRDPESGRTGWVVRGGSDTMGADAPAEPAETSEPAETPPTEPPSGGDRPLSEMEHDELVKLADRLKKENVRSKERYRPYEEAFDGVPPETVQVLGQFSKMLMSQDPTQVGEAARWMRENLDALSPAEQKAVQAIADEASQAAGGDDEFDPFDREAIEKLAEERAQNAVRAALEERDRHQSQEQQMVALRVEMDAEATSLAKKLELPELGEKGSIENEMLWVLAAKGDRSVPWKENLQAAAEQVHATFAKASQKYLERKSAEADAPAAPPEGGAPSGSRTPKTIAEASKSALERLAKSAEGRPGR